MAGKLSKQERYVIFGAVGVIAASIFTTLVVSGVIFNVGGGDEGGYQNVTFTDAVISCQDQTRNSFGNKLTNMVLDDHSSRFDQRSNMYKIFFQVEVTRSKEQENNGFYVNCFVSASRGLITEFESLEQKVTQTETIRRERGGVFGWPMKE